MFKKNIIFICFICLSFSLAYAEDVFKTNEKINEGIELGADEVNLKRVPEEILRDAEKSIELMNKTTKKDSINIMKSMDFNSDTGVITFNKDYKTDKDLSNGKIIKSNKYFNSDERLYIFISSSMPINILKTYCKSVHDLGISQNAIFILRGCVNGGGYNGCKHFKPTIDFIKSFISNNKKEIDKTCKVWIDPVLFKRYEVKEVPTFVYANNVVKNIELGSEGNFNLLKKTPIFYKSIGDWSLLYHIEELKKYSQTDSLNKIFNEMKEKDINGEKN